MKDRNLFDENCIHEITSSCAAVPKDLQIRCFDLTDSTNNDAKCFARTASSDCVFVAKRQSAGRGRLGRSFSSDEGGLYMSFLFGRKMMPEDALKITVFAAVCVRRAVWRLTGLDIKIKWVNDIFLDEKKLAGILCEGACDEFGQISFAVLGIGINIKRLCKRELSEIATSLEEHMPKPPTAIELAAQIIKEIYILSSLDFASVLDEYIERSCIIGKCVRVIKVSEEYTARVLGIDENASLIVETKDGTRQSLSTGEVSIRS